MQMPQQLPAKDFGKQHAVAARHDGQVHCVRVGACASRRLSESSANLLSLSGSDEELVDFGPNRLCSLQMQRSTNEVDFNSFQKAGLTLQGFRPMSSDSLTFNGYASPSSGHSTPTSSEDSRVCSIASFSAAAVQSIEDITSSATVPAAPSPISRNGHSIDSFCADSTVQDPAFVAEGLSNAIPACDANRPPYSLREIHPFDMQLAHMLAAVSQAADASPAHLLLILLSFAPDDYQDLVNAVVESGSSCVYLLACHLHNLRTMAEEAIDDSSSAAEHPGGKESTTGVSAVSGGGGDSGSTTAMKSPGKPFITSGNGNKKGKAASSTVAAREVDPEDKEKATQALRASIMNQYRRVLCRLVGTALGLLNRETRQTPFIPPPPPPPPPPLQQQNSRGGVFRGGVPGGGGGHTRVEQLNRSMSVPISSCSPTPFPSPLPVVIPTAAAVRGGGSVFKATSHGTTACSSPALSTSGMNPRVGGPTSAAPRSISGSSGTNPAFAAPSAEPPHNFTVENMMHAAMQKLSPKTASIDVVESLTGQHGISTAASAAASAVLSMEEHHPSGTPRSMADQELGFSVLPAAVLPSQASAMLCSRPLSTGSYSAVGSGAGLAAPQLPSNGRPIVGPLAAVPTVRMVGAQIRGPAAASGVVPQRLQPADPSSEQRHAAAMLLQHQQQQLQLLHQQQVQYQLERQQQLQELHLLELLAAVNVDGGVGGAQGLALGMAVPSLTPPMIPPSKLASAQADALGMAAAAAQFMQAPYGGANPLRDPASWQHSLGPLAALQWQFPPVAAHQSLAGLGQALPTQLGVAQLSPQQKQHLVMMMMQGGLLPTGSGAGGQAAASVVHYRP